MHLPCPSCGTVYDIDLAVYVPGTVFECVRCQARVTVPASVEEPAAAPEPEVPAAAQETRANPLDETDELVDALTTSMISLIFAAGRSNDTPYRLEIKSCFSSVKCVILGCARAGEIYVGTASSLPRPNDSRDAGSRATTRSFCSLYLIL